MAKSMACLVSLSGLVFNYVDVAAPIIEGYSIKDQTSVKVQCTYPTVQGSKVAAIASILPMWVIVSVILATVPSLS